jgi:hypothetical protein
MLAGKLEKFRHQVFKIWFSFQKVMAESVEKL